MITAAQCRAARGLLDWTQQELADAAHIGVATVRLFESEATETRHATLAVLRQAFELAGVEFTNGDQPGVRLTKAAAAQRWSRLAGQDGGLAKVDSVFDYAANFSSFAWVA
jgi:transcriptional regulator with XRE-family HTH domain